MEVDEASIIDGFVPMIDSDSVAVPACPAFCVHSFARQFSIFHMSSLSLAPLWQAVNKLRMKMSACKSRIFILWLSRTGCTECAVWICHVKQSNMMYCSVQWSLSFTLTLTHTTTADHCSSPYIWSGAELIMPRLFYDVRFFLTEVSKVVAAATTISRLENRHRGWIYGNNLLWALGVPLA